MNEHEHEALADRLYPNEQRHVAVDGLIRAAEVPPQHRDTTRDQLHAELGHFPGVSIAEWNGLFDRLAAATNADANPPLNDRYNAIADGLKDLRQRHGPGVDHEIAELKALMARAPRLAKALHATGLGNDPEVANMLLSAVRHRRARGMK